MGKNVCSVCNKELDDHALVLNKDGVAMAASQYNLGEIIICMTSEEPDFERVYC